MTDEFKKPAQLRKLERKGHGKKKQKTVRQNVLHPMLITVSAINLVIVIFFNLVMLLMLYTNMLRELNSISSVVYQLSELDTEENDRETAAFKIYTDEIVRRNVSYRSNMIVVNSTGSVVRSVDDIRNEEIELVESCLKAEPNYVYDDFIMFKTDGDVLIFLPVRLDDNSENTVYMYASLKSLFNSVMWSNKALLVIVALSVMGFVLASNIISVNISKPIKQLSDHMEKIGDGDFTPVTVKATSSELDTLTVSINEMLARLKAYNDAYTISIQNLSHDLRTPLMSIRGYAEAIKYGVLDNTEDAADVIIKESQRLTEVVEKMLILSELDALNRQIDTVPILLSDFLRDEATRIEGYAMQNHVTIKCIFENEDTTVSADIDLLYTIVRNLLSNAIRYAESTVEVCVFETDEEACVCVSDDGKGLSEDDKKYLFVRYYVGETGHSGLGLSTAKSAAEYMGCTLTGQNRNELPDGHFCKSDRGAVFTLSFPKNQ